MKYAVEIMQADTGFVVSGGNIGHQETHAVADLEQAINKLREMFNVFVAVPDPPLVPGSLSASEVLDRDN